MVVATPGDEGQVYVCRDPASGLSGSADWTVESDQDSAMLGRSVGTAGDVNGDGYADVVVGAHLYDDGQMNEGRVFLYYGNGGDGLDLLPRQWRTDGSAPIASLGKSDSATSVQLRLTGRMPLRREKVKLQWQVAPLGTPFTATSIVSGTSAAWTDVLTTEVTITQNVTGLATSTPYHWRVRLLYRPGNRLGQHASRWIHMPWHGWAEQDFRTATASVVTTTRTITYTYDPLSRLTSADYSTGESFQYAYDAASNVTAMTETITATIVTTYTYNAANQLATARASDDSVTWYYTFDQRGNLTRQTPGGTALAEGETRYTYNSAGQLVRVELYTAGAYTTLATAAYNADGERVRLTTWAEGAPLTVTYAVFQGELLASDDGAQARLYLHGQNPIAEYSNEWAYQLRDGTGSVRQVADGSGNITLARTYKPFGGILQEQGTYETAFGFLGAQLDRVSGLLYAGGRYYDPATGRYLTPRRDFNPYDPRTLNRYAPLQDPTLWLLAPLGLVTALLGRKRRKWGHWLLLLLVVGAGISIVLVGCAPPPPSTPTPEPSPPSPPTQPPTPEPTPTPLTPTPSGKTAYLTFDDGPDPSFTPQIALALQSRGMQATFFLTGTDVDWERIRSVCAPEDVPTEWANVEVVKLLWASGHAIGLHGWLHTNAWNSPTVDPSQEIRLVEDALKSILGITELPDRLLRAPYGAFPDVPVSGYSGWYYYGWNIDAKDYYGVDAQTIINNVLGQLAQKGLPDNPIILLHSIRPGTYEAIVDPRYDLLGKLVEAGYTQFRKLPRPGDPVDTAIWP